MFLYELIHRHHGRWPRPPLLMRLMNHHQLNHLSLDLLDSHVLHAPAPPPPETGRSKAVANVTAFRQHLALSRISGRVSDRDGQQLCCVLYRTYDTIMTIIGWPAIAWSVLRRIESWDQDKSASLSRSQYEIYSFSTKYDLP